MTTKSELGLIARIIASLPRISLQASARPQSDPRHSRQFFLVALFCMLPLKGLANTIPEAWRDDAGLRDVHFVDGEFGWCVGDGGVIWHTDNGGEIWRAQRSGVDYQLNTVFFVDRRIGYAAGGKVVPLTHRSTAVFLRTTDGGRTWEQTEGLLIPWINRIHFRNPLHGYAVGMASALYPSGCWVTRDAGRTWTPVTGVNESWSDATFLSPTSSQKAGNRSSRVGTASGLLTSKNGRVAWLNGDRLLAASNLLESPSQRQLLNRPISTLLAPSAGIAGIERLQISGDGGNSWQPLGSSPIQSAMDFEPMSIVSSPGHLWMAGSPGTRILHSQDMGRSWTVAPTHSTLPIRRLYFHDKNHGWAVGSHGLILATKDGGASWKQQRGQSKRMALVGVFADEHKIPWEMLTQVSAQQAYRVHIVLLAEKSHDALTCTTESRLSEAAAKIGASAEVLTRLSYPDEIDASPQDLLARWGKHDQQTGHSTVDLLTRKLARLLRVYRPDVVVTSRSDGQVPKGSQQLLTRLLLDATQFAAHSEMYPQQLGHLGLQPWPVSRVLAHQPTNGKPVVLDSVSTVLGTSVSDLARQAERLVSESPSMTGTTAWSLFTVEENGKSSEFGRRPLLSSSIQYDSAPRRPRTIAFVDVVSQKKMLQQLLQARRVANAENVVGRGDKRIQQIERLLANRPRVLGDTLFDLAMQEASRGNSSEATLLLQYFIKRHPEHALVDQSLHWLTTYYSSLERQWMRPDEPSSILPVNEPTKSQVQMAVATTPVSPTGIPQRPEPIRIASTEYHIDEEALRELQEIEAEMVRNGELPPSEELEQLRESPALESIPKNARAIAEEEVTFTPNWMAGLQLAQTIKRTKPAYFGEPSALFSLAAILRADGQANTALSYYRRMQSQPSDSIWRMRAADEMLRISDERSQDLSTSLWTSKSFAKRPILDGRFEETVYQGGTVLQLSNEKGLPPTQVVVGNDDAFLYIAAICPKRSDAKYLPKRRPRPRDADLTSLDRLRFRFDINRDYASWWCIQVDHRGWTRDSLDFATGDSDWSWNPKYYVASETNEDSWTIEMAIPLDQLAPNEYRSSEWTFGVDRIVPKIHLEAWNTVQAAKGDPLQGILRVGSN